jgi:hypothetical protein
MRNAASRCYATINAWDLHSFITTIQPQRD